VTAALVVAAPGAGLAALGAVGTANDGAELIETEAGDTGASLGSACAVAGAAAASGGGGAVSAAAISVTISVSGRWVSRPV